MARPGHNSVRPAAKAFLQTMNYVEELKGSESHGTQPQNGEESDLPKDDETSYGGARIGDLIQWDHQGVLQFEKPLRVRLVSEDGQWVAVEGSRTGIPMGEVIVETPAPKAEWTPPVFEFEKPKQEKESDFEEWFRAKVGTEKQVQISYKGDGDIGAREIQKLIDILTAQKNALED